MFRDGDGYRRRTSFKITSPVTCYHTNVGLKRRMSSQQNGLSVAAKCGCGCLIGRIVFLQVSPNLPPTTSRFSVTPINIQCHTTRETTIRISLWSSSLCILRLKASSPTHAAATSSKTMDAHNNTQRSTRSKGGGASLRDVLDLSTMFVDCETYFTSDSCTQCIGRTPEERVLRARAMKNERSRR